MKRFLLIIIITVFIGALVLLSQSGMRHIVFSGITQFPEFATMQAMKGGLVTRDFDRVIPWLERQHALASSYGGVKNRLTPGLLENIKKAYEVAVLREERERFIIILEKAYILNPNNIDLNIMLASAHQFLDEKKSLLYLNQARKIIPSDLRIYHLANIILRDSEDLEERSYWCEAYTKEQFGDYEAYKSSTLLGGGYRRLALEFSNKDKRDLFLNEGVQLNQRLQYEFIMDDTYQLLSPSLRLATGGGLKVQFHNIKLFAGGELIKSYSRDSIQLFPETGFVINGHVISSNPLGENIFIELFDIDDYKSDKVILELTINKLLLDNSSICRT